MSKNKKKRRKKFSDLKMKQREKITESLYEGYEKHVIQTGMPPCKGHGDEEIIEKTLKEIEDAKIIIPTYEICKRYQARKFRFRKRVNKKFNMQL